MDAELLDRKIEIISGHIEAMKIMVVTTALLTPNRAELLKLYQELLNSQRELLHFQSVSEEFLAGLDLAGDSMLELISLKRT